MSLYWLGSFFIVIMLLSGVAGYLKTKTVDDFVIGNRNVGPWLSAFAYGTTYFSAVIFIGYAGKVGYSFGLPALWIAVGNAVLGSFIAWKVLAKRTRVMTAELNARTMPEFLAARYNFPQYKYIAALIIFVFLVPYSASVYMGLSYFFEAVFNMPYVYALLLMAGLTSVYLVLGGYHAVALTDFIQGLIMLLGVFLMLYYIITSPVVGGVSEITSRLREVKPEYVSLWGGKGFSAILFLMLLTSLGTWGLPQMVQKFYAIKDERAVKPATYISSLFALIIAGSAYLVGALTPLFFKSIPLDPVLMKPNPDLIVPQLLSQFIPPWVAALILLLVLSASMSTLSSLVLVSSSAVSVDLLGDFAFFRENNRQVLVLRVLSLLFIAFSVFIAMKKPTIILSLMALSWGAVSGSFLAPYLYGLFSKRTTAFGALAGTVTGISLSLCLSFYYGFNPSKLPLVGVAAMVAPLIVVPVASRLK
ncbi:MAG: sodium:solute symporter [bacterium]